MMQWFNWRRFFCLLRKEGVQIVRDPSALLVAFVLPVTLLLLNGYGLSLDAKNVPFGVVVEISTPQTASLYRAFADTPYFRAHRYHNAAEAEISLMKREINGYVVIRADTIRRLPHVLRQQPYLVTVDGVDANTGRIVQGYALGVLTSWYLREPRLNTVLPEGMMLQHRYWFNPELSSAFFIVPGLIAVIMTLVGALLTALIVAREWERGTMETLMASPASTCEVVFSKLLSNFVLGMTAMAISVGLAILLFSVPFRGSLPLLLLTSGLFLMSSLAFGLLISTATKSQFISAQLTFVLTYMPSLMLSGLLFDIASMPLWVQDLTHLVAARYFVACLQTLFLAGDVGAILLPNGLMLAVFAICFFALALRRMPRTLED
jgi:ABC-2 type transport system permease protein